MEKNEGAAVETLREYIAQQSRGATPLDAVFPDEAIAALKSIVDERNLVMEQIKAVDAALGPWEPEPGSETGCVGRVQTILNLRSDREELDRLQKLLARF